MTVILDMLSFLFVFFIAIFAFANAFFILGFNKLTLEGDNYAGRNFVLAVIYSYWQALGQWETGGFKQPNEIFISILWLLNTIISLIILLNLVIALMGDTFDKVNESASKVEIQEKAVMICKNEFCFSWWIFFWWARYILVISPETASSGAGEWDGKVNQLKTYIENS